MAIRIILIPVEKFGLSLVFAAALTLALFIPAVTVSAQYSSEADQQSFDYNPAPSELPELQRKTVSVDYADAELINDPVQGVFMVSKNRWKNWVARAVYLLLLDIALMIILLSLPKNDEHNIIISYVISGAGAVLSFWVLLCAWLLFRLHASAWLMVLPLSLLMAAVTYIVLMKVKDSDVSLTELRESFQRMSALSNEDLRLVSVEGRPGDWPDQDFIK